LISVFPPACFTSLPGSPDGFHLQILARVCRQFQQHRKPFFAQAVVPAFTAGQQITGGYFAIPGTQPTTDTEPGLALRSARPWSDALTGCPTRPRRHELLDAILPRSSLPEGDVFLVNSETEQYSLEKTDFRRASD